MKWEKEAQQKLNKIPFFIRKRVKSIVEEKAKKKGLPVVSIQEMETARTHFLRKVDTDTTEKDTIKKELVLYEIKVCRGENTGCPFMIASGKEVSDALFSMMEECKFTKRRKEKLEGLILPHHTFKISISTCPNGCSQPQIRDIGILLQAVPQRGEGKCSNCKLCVESCKEEAVCIKQTGDERCPVIDAVRCVSCGICARVCPSQALILEKIGYRLLAGGKLGRHPMLAQEIQTFCTQEELIEKVRELIEYFLEKAEKEEKMGDLLA